MTTTRRQEASILAYWEPYRNDVLRLANDAGIAVSPNSRRLLLSLQTLADNPKPQNLVLEDTIELNTLLAFYATWWMMREAGSLAVVAVPSNLRRRWWENTTEKIVMSFPPHLSTHINLMSAGHIHIAEHAGWGMRMVQTEQEILVRRDQAPQLAIELGAQDLPASLALPGLAGCHRLQTWGGMSGPAFD